MNLKAWSQQPTVSRNLKLLIFQRMGLRVEGLNEGQFAFSAQLVHFSLTTIPNHSNTATDNDLLFGRDCPRMPTVFIMSPPQGPCA